MGQPACENCKLRASYDRNPRSLSGRFWRWHMKWCPGWKGNTRAISEEKKAELAQKYNLTFR